MLKHSHSLVTLATLNLETIVRFYEKLLAKKPNIYHSNSYAEFDLANLKLGIFRPQTNQIEEFSQPPKSALSICLQVEDISAPIELLSNLGHPPITNIMQTDHGQEFYAYDPDGNRLIFYQPMVSQRSTINCQQVWLDLLKAQKSIAVIRSREPAISMKMAQAIAQGGMRLIEITWNSSNPTELIKQLRAELPDCLIGAGTLLNLDDLKTAINCGAQFLFTPHTDPHLIKVAIDQGLPIIPGALSPTEIVTAWQAGATCVKVFPISAVGGANYLRNLQGPLGEIPLIPTGGITLNNAKLMLEAGAIAVGLAGDLFRPELIDRGEWDQVSNLAQTLLNHLND